MTQNADTPIVEVSGVSRRFGEVLALDRVSFTAHAGESFFLLGPSGCGKTTLLRILAGLEASDSGRVCLRGRDMAVLPPHRRGAPMVFQNYALWPHLSVADNIAFGLVERRVPRAERRARVDAALRQVGLSGLHERMPGQLSGGQQQRVVLARALVVNPDVILLDEPLSNLDARLRHDMRAEIERLHAETGITFIYVTHDQVEALSLADRLAVMNGGRIDALGTPHALYHRPPTLFCATFLGESNLVSGRVVSAQGDRCAVRTPLGTWQAVCPPGTGPASGDTVTCLVRPENLRPALPGAVNAFDAAVVSARSAGGIVSVKLAAGPVTLCAHLLNAFDLRLPKGPTSAWEAPVEDTVALPADPAPETPS